jgi:ribosomal protein L30E
VLTVETVKRLGGKKAIDALNSGRAKIVMIG